MKALGTCRYLMPLAFCIFTPSVAAQTLEPGQRVRISTRDLGSAPLVGEVVRVEQDSLVLQSDGAPWSLARSSIVGVEVASGAHRHTLRGALVGSLAVGAALGQDMLRKPGQCSGSGNYGQLCALFLAGAMVGGAVVGGIIGAAIRHDDWISVSLEAPHAWSPGRTHLLAPLLVAISIRPGSR